MRAEAFENLVYLGCFGQPHVRIDRQTCCEPSARFDLFMC